LVPLSANPFCTPANSEDLLLSTVAAAAFLSFDLLAVPLLAARASSHSFLYQKKCGSKKTQQVKTFALSAALKYESDQKQFWIMCTVKTKN
jgi:hypothetical protein